MEQFADLYPHIPIRHDSPLYAQAIHLLNLLEIGVSIQAADIAPKVLQAMEFVASTRQRLEAQYRDEERRVQAAVNAGNAQGGKR